MVGDGELQEGQNYEGLQAAAHERLAGPDGRRRPQRAPVRQADGRDRLPRRPRGAARARSAGTSQTCDGHDVDAAPRRLRRRSATSSDRPQALVARTIKGKGVSFMEHPAALREGGGTYRWHAGAPDDASFERAFAELVARIDERLSALGLEPLALEPVEERGTVPGERSRASPSRARARGRRRSRTSTSSTRTATSSCASARSATTSSSSTPTSPPTAACVPSSSRIPDRFVECGIAEQDMVSTAAGLARHGLLPGRQLVRVVPRVAGERADLQPGERADEGRLCAPLRRAHPGRPREVAPVGPRHLAPRRAPGPDDRAARKLRRRRARSCAGPSSERRRRRRDPARHRTVAAADRAARRRRARTRPRCSATETTRSSSRTGR